MPAPSREPGVISRRPFWLDTVSEADFRVPGQVLAGELPAAARVAILGGGIVGLACAHYLAEAPGPGTFHELGRASQELIAAFASQADADLEYRCNGVLQVALSEAEAEALRARAATLGA